MNLTNNQNVPPSVLRWLSADLYDGYSDDPKTISATTLIKPTQEVVLAKQHPDKLTVDAMDRLWALRGQGIHAVLETVAGHPPVRTETKLNGWTITGKYDNIEPDRTLEDYKDTNVFTYVYGNREDEHRKQLSLYRWILSRQSPAIETNTRARIIMFFRDWRESELAKIKNYPPLGVMQFEYECESLEETEAWVKMRLLAIEGGLAGGLLHCTDDERWLNKGKYAKCAKYCSVRSVCTQGGQS